MADMPRGKAGSLLFVYGTLMTGFHNNFILQQGEATWLRDVTTHHAWDLVRLGGFPGMVPGANRVRGELYIVSDETLRRCDQLEGVPDFYERIDVEVEGMPGGPLIVQAYLWPARNQELRNGQLLEVNRWRDWISWRDHAPRG
jgi:gamma-glutamylcyclotransferase (GGCT)/AIG2-like uncharacterized protein YtfP